MEYAALAWHFVPLRVLFRTQGYEKYDLALNLNSSHPFISKFDKQFFARKLLKEQLADGSWKQLVDENQKEGSLDATIFNCKDVRMKIGT